MSGFPVRFWSLAALLFCFCFVMDAQSFHNPRRVPLPSTPETVLAGDLNGDGVPDLVYGTESGMQPTVTAALHVLLADGKGGYTAGQDVVLPRGGLPRCLLVDLNGDKASDLVCGSGYSGLVTVIAGKGDGTFGQTRTLTLPDVQDEVVPVAVGDVNGDGSPDVILLDGNGLSLYPLVNDGSGNLSVAQAIAASVYGNHVTLADLNEDGHPDLLVQASNLNTQVFLGKGDGTFTALPQFSGNSGSALADMDGDGHLDLVGGQLGILRIFHGNADGTFASSPTATADFTDGNPYDGSGSGVYTYPFAVLDLNGDGVLDVLAFGNNGLTLLQGKPGLAFGTPQSVPVGEDLSFGPQQGVQQFLDMDGDGHPDFVCPGPNGVYISYGRADGTFVSADVYAAGSFVTDATLADFTGDGHPDAVTAGNAQLLLSKGEAGGTFAAPTAIPFPLPASENASLKGYSQVLHGDVNGDGNQDLVALGSFEGQTTAKYVLLGHGDGSFAAPVQLPGSDDGYFLFAVLDLNGDGRADIVEKGSDNSLKLYLAQADGSFKASSIQGAPPATEPQVVFLADVDGDRIPDLIMAVGEGVTVSPGHGDGSYGAPITFALQPLQSGLGQSATSVAVGDFDGDGRPDIAVLLGFNAPNGGTAQSDTRIATLYGQGSAAGLSASSFATAIAGPMSTQPYAQLLAVDLDGDGRTDLVAQAVDFASFPDAIGTFPGQADRTFGGESLFVAGTYLTTPQLADLNGDGRPDIVVGNGKGNAFTVLLSEGPVLPQGTLVATPNPVPQAVPFQITAKLQAGGGVAVPNGSVTFSVDGQSAGTVALSGGTAAIAGPLTLTPGQHALSAVTSALTTTDGNSYPAVHLTGQVTVLPQATVLTLAGAPNPAGPGQQVSFTVQLSNGAGAASGVPVPTGTITLSVAGKTIGSVSVAGDTTSSGIATYSFAAAGRYSVLASYSGDARHSGTTATVVEVVNAAPDFSMDLSPSRVALQAGQQVAVATQVQSLGGYAGMVQLTLSGLPTGLSATFQPEVVPIAQGKASSAKLLISAGQIASAAGSARHPSDASHAGRIGAGVVLGCLLPIGLRRRRKLGRLVVFVAGAVILTALQGCTDIAIPLLTPGTYNVIVTASDPAAKLTHTSGLQILIGSETTGGGGPH